jgi:hypothetical protein
VAASIACRVPASASPVSGASDGTRELPAFWGIDASGIWSVGLHQKNLADEFFDRAADLQAPNLAPDRAFAFAASSSRFFGGALVSSERRRRLEIPAISSIADWNEPAFAFDGLVNPLIFLTN